MIIGGVAFHHKWVRGTHGGYQTRAYAKSAVFFFFFFFFCISPRMSGILKLLHLFGFNQMIIKMFLISVG